MGLALVAFKKHAGRPVQLEYYHPLRAVDHEGPGLGHQREFAHVDFLFLDILYYLVAQARFLVVNDQPYLGLQRCRVSESPHFAFLDVKRRFIQPVADILQGGIAGIAVHRENRLERGM